MKTKRSFLAGLVFVSCFGLSLLPSYVKAADFFIVPIPKNYSQQLPNDFIEALNLTKTYSSKPYAFSLWPWQEIDNGRGPVDIDRPLGGIKYAISLGLSGPKYFGVNVINTTNNTLPESLAKRKWDDPAILERYRQTLLAVRENLGSDVTYFVIANEADVYFDKNPHEFKEFMRFYRQAKAVAKKVFPAAKIGVTVTFEGTQVSKNRARFVRALVDASDAAFFTFYPVIQMKPVDPANTPQLLDYMLALANKMTVVLQEVGYPSVMAETSPEKQAAFYSTIIPEIKKRPRIAFSGLFAMHDFDPKSCDNFLVYYGFSESFVSQDAKDAFRSFICSLGLRDSDGMVKPSWGAALKAIKH